MEKLLDLLQVLEKHLRVRNFLVGHQLSLADVVVALTSWGLFEGGVIDVKVRKEQLPNLQRYTQIIVAQPTFKSLIA